MRLSHVPLRLATGAFILNSGLSKRGMDAARAEGLHGMAKGAYPFLAEIEPIQFADLLSKSETALGAGLLTPLVPSGLIGAALAAFSGALVGIYLRTPSLRKEGSLAPAPPGVAIAKDVWMLGIGLALVIDSLTRRRRR
ncbi:MAG: hypothetical protein ACREQM_20485 [Candidatus Dormibacteraceae bacterium]